MLLLKMRRYFWRKEKTLVKISGLVAVCFLIPLSATGGGTGHSQIDQSISSFLESNSEASIFVTALKQSDHWRTLGESDVLSLFVPTDEALHSEGSAFLLEVVLGKIENKERLDNLMAMHIHTEAIQIDAEVDRSVLLSVPGGGCLEIQAIDGSIKIGPEANLINTVTAANGSIYFVDHLLWQPYKDQSNCS